MGNKRSPSLPEPEKRPQVPGQVRLVPALLAVVASGLAIVLWPRGAEPPPPLAVLTEAQVGRLEAGQHYRTLVNINVHGEVGAEDWGAGGIGTLHWVSELDFVPVLPDLASACRATRLHLGSMSLQHGRAPAGAAMTARTPPLRADFFRKLGRDPFFGHVPRRHVGD